MRLIVVLLLACISSFAYAKEPVALASGYGDLNYNVTKPGKYKLYDLGLATDGKVITASNKAMSLYDLYNDKVVVLGFVYLSCSDVNGCPLTTFVINQVKKEVEQIKEISDNIRFVSLSFDPNRDTPKVLTEYGKHTGANDDLWSLLTTSSEAEIEIILQSYNQPIQKIYDENGKETGKINHVLRVFLIDKKKRIRNIYSNAFLHKEIMLADIKTLLIEEQKEKAQIINTE